MYVLAETFEWGWQFTIKQLWQLSRVHKIRTETGVRYPTLYVTEAEAKADPKKQVCLIRLSLRCAPKSGLTVKYRFITAFNELMPTRSRIYLTFSLCLVSLVGGSTIVAHI